MALVATDPKAAKRLGIPRKVGRDFIEADKGKHFPNKHVRPKTVAEVHGR